MMHNPITKISRTAALSFLMLLHIPASAQTEGEAASDLVITQQHNPVRSTTIPLGTELRIRTRTQGPVQGKLMQVQDSSFTIGETIVPKTAATKVAIRKGHTARTLGSIGLLFTAYCAFVSSVCLTIALIMSRPYSGEPDDPGTPVTLLAFAFVFFGTIATLLALPALITYLIGRALGRTFRLGNKWRIGFQKH